MTDFVWHQTSTRVVILVNNFTAEWKEDDNGTSSVVGPSFHITSNQLVVTSQHETLLSGTLNYEILPHKCYWQYFNGVLGILLEKADKLIWERLFVPVPQAKISESEADTQNASTSAVTGT